MKTKETKRRKRPLVGQPATVQLYHLRFFVNGEISPKGGVTIAIDPLRKVWAASWCSPEDNFCKWRGALAAIGRLRKYGPTAGQSRALGWKTTKAWRLPQEETIRDTIARIVQGAMPLTWLHSVGRWLARRNLSHAVLATKSGSIALKVIPSGEWAIIQKEGVLDET